MKLNWQQQTIVVTGAYGGLGRELCKQLDKLGAHLIITGRNEEKLKALKKELSEATKILVGGVLEKEFQNKLLALLQEQSAQKTSGHILINNAAISTVNFLEGITDSDISHMLNTNLLAPMLLSKKLLPWLKSAESAKIINIGSTFGTIGYPGFSGYCASKFGLRGFSQALSRELADTNIIVQYLAPRAIVTDINSNKVNHLNQQLKNNVDTPEQIVPQIIQAVEDGKTEKHFGWPEKLFAKINGLFPSVVAGSIKKEHQTIKQILTKNR